MPAVSLDIVENGTIFDRAVVGDAAKKK